MYNVLIFSAFNDFSAVECAVDQVRKGNAVTVLCCDHTMRVCMHNVYGNKMMCQLCHKSMENAWKKSGVYDKVRLLHIAKVVTEQDKATAKGYDVSFESIKELKQLKYKCADVGYGAFSSYVTMTRNVMPEMSANFKSFISFLIRKEITLYEIGERLLHSQKYDLVIFHNGRFALYKPFLSLARNHKIDFIATEHDWSNGSLSANFFINDVPHSIEYLAKKTKWNWEQGNPEEREDIGRSFYERRRNGVYAGDKVYVKDQKKGLLPDVWDDNVENISIFNSSEDEFCAISEEYDSYLLYPFQYDALKSIFDHYKDDKTKHFYLRIHPNLKSVPFKSHLILYELNYPNVTIIPPDSPISSYTLMDNSDKILIFYSTMGMEATYWGKPVIALSKYIYYYFDNVYTPTTPEEVWKLINTPNLQVKQNHNLIEYGYWLLHNHLPPYKNVDIKKVDFKFMGRSFSSYNIMKLWGSYKAIPLLEWFFRKFLRFKPLCVFSKLPETEPYNLNG